MAPKVWIVQHDDSPDNTVVGAFTTQGEAGSFAEEMSDRFENGLLYSAFNVGYRYDQGTGYAAFGPDSSGCLPVPCAA